MEVIQTIAEMQRRADSIRRSGRKIGVVPTMGSLHEGHTSLIEVARSKSDTVITTIFVNPTQFGPKEDFERYPRDLEGDTLLATKAGTDLIFAPEVGEMYRKEFGTYVVPGEISSVLEGAVRPTHFRGVTTVVAKLFHSTKPHVAVFGQKDAQQVFMIRQMILDLNFDVELVVAPIVREPDGLAKSSRNRYLSNEERRNAAVLFQALQEIEARIQKGGRDVVTLRGAAEAVIRRGKPTAVDYVALVNPETFREVQVIEPPGILALLAVRFGSTRLIDNQMISIF